MADRLGASKAPGIEDADVRPSLSFLPLSLYLFVFLTFLLSFYTLATSRLFLSSCDRLQIELSQAMQPHKLSSSTCLLFPKAWAQCQELRNDTGITSPALGIEVKSSQYFKCLLN